MFDACASWWTQESVTANRDEVIAAAAAGQAGHVIFPDVVHAPAVALSQSWWARRVRGTVG
jgi:dethiobiotin synthetase/adenosylmethionine--8-amino-7-oxononanoate aminotransferase